MSRYLKDESDPDLTLEILSNKEKGKIGWTLNRESKADFILYVWDPADFNGCYLLPFPSLRIVFEIKKKEWTSKYKIFEDKNDGYNGYTWHSTGVFVPASVVREAIESTFPFAHTMSKKSVSLKATRRIKSMLSKSKHILRF